jgi:tRNA (cmo5U34)-methyltransferase
MLQEAERKMRNYTAVDYCFLEPCATQDIESPQDESPDVITAVLCHHYLNKNGRKNAQKDVSTC